MRHVRNILLITLVLTASFYLIEQMKEPEEEASGKLVYPAKGRPLVMKEKSLPETEENLQSDGGIFHWLGKSEEELAGSLGEPERIDGTPYGYDWWIYKEDNGRYLQFGLEEKEIKTIYMNGEGEEALDIRLGDTYEAINKVHPFDKEVTYGKGLSFFTFELTKEDLSSRPLVKLNDTSFVQLYFDTFNGTLSSIRLLDGDILLRHRPYGLRYRGELPEDPELGEEEWKRVERGMEQQIFDITNLIRDKHGMKLLDWDGTVSQVAYAHSRDMAENDYFSHSSLNGDGLQERLAAEKVFYQGAGENIAAQYPDAISAVEGWLNSDGHREALLSGEYSHLGVGVYRFHYTQNFLDRPM